MKIGITADLHLKSKDETPERYNALENIIADLHSKNINRLIVAGDLFDRERYNYNDFDAFCKQYRDIDFYITPGNHDVGIEPRFFSASNIRLFIVPTLVEIDHIPFLFLPYTSSGSMDELLTSFFADKALPDKWVLIGHGDYLEINKSADEYEKDYYMPLSNKVIREMKPLRAFLGHIHKASDSGIVSYPGSPYPLNVNETGKRRFLIYNTDTDSVESRYPHTDIVYMIEKLLIIPTENEIDDALEKIDHAIAKWGFTDEELSKVKLRLILKGFTNDKGALMDAVTRQIRQKGLSFYDAEGPQSEALNIVIDKEREAIMNRVLENISSLPDFDYADKDDIVEQALNLIYKG